MPEELTIEKFYKELIPSVKEGFKPRVGQEDLSNLIQQAITDNKYVIAEAPTGAGKSFAVLIPSIIAAVQNGKRIVISTETLTLQDQYISKDLPLLHNACKSIGIDFTYSVAKGKSNYTCLSKLDEDNFVSASKLMRWAKKQQISVNTGDISSIPFDFDVEEWRKIAADEDCHKKACPNYGQGALLHGHTDCFAYEARKQYLQAQIVVTNHTMLLLDAMVGVGTLLGLYDVLIVDEAHSLCEKARDAWGSALKHRTISSTLHFVQKLLQKGNVNLDINFEQYRDLEDSLFKHFNPLIGKSLPLVQVRTEIIDKAREEAEQLIDKLKGFNKNLNKGLTDTESNGNSVIETSKERISKLISTLTNIFVESDSEHKDNWLAFLSTNLVKGSKVIELYLKPIEVAPLMNGLILSKVPSCTFLSATMMVNNSFYFMRHELGLAKDKTLEFIGKSPFDYKSQVQCYYPKDLPDVKNGEEEYINSLTTEIIKIIKYMNGKTMILFTNMSHMKTVYYKVRTNVKYEVFLQGQSSKNTTISQFQETIDSCLFATRSFFTGVDIPGEALSCVVLVKAPFVVPSEPLFKARCEIIDNKGGSSFKELSMPLMLFDIKQAFGRLIRTTEDTGLFCFLDSRAMKTSYWRSICETLPQGIKSIKELK